MTSTLHIAGISGSLRKNSYNTALLRAAGELLPDGMELEIVDISKLPLFNEDIEKPFPESVQEFRTRLAAADAFLIATPEYNFSMPGVLKNALDWASRPPGPSLQGKPGAIMGASGGLFGTVRAQQHLRQVLQHENAYVLNKPEVYVPQVQNKFSPDGHLADEPTRKFVADLMQALENWIHRHA